MSNRKPRSTGLFDDDNLIAQRRGKRIKRSSLKTRISRIKRLGKYVELNRLSATTPTTISESSVATLSNQDIIRLIFRLARLELRKEAWHERVTVEGDDLDMRLKIQRSNLEYHVSICRYENCISVNVAHTDKRNNNQTTDHRREIPATKETEDLYFKELDILLTEKSKVQYDSSMEDAIVAAFGDIQDELVLSDDTNILEIVDKKLEESDETEGDNN